MAPSSEAIIQGVITTLEAIPEVGTVVSQEGGQSTWARAPGSGQFYWIVGPEGVSTQRHGIGGAGLGNRSNRSRERRIVINGWTPWNYTESSADLWRAKLEAVEWQLLTHRGMGVCARMVGLPVLEANKIEPYTSLNPNDIPRECHHARILLTFRNHHAVTATG